MDGSKEPHRSTSYRRRLKDDQYKLAMLAKKRKRERPIPQPNETTPADAVASHASVDTDHLKNLLPEETQHSDTESTYQVPLLSPGVTGDEMAQDTSGDNESLVILQNLEPEEHCQLYTSSTSKNLISHLRSNVSPDKMVGDSTSHTEHAENFPKPFPEHTPSTSQFVISPINSTVTADRMAGYCSSDNKHPEILENLVLEKHQPLHASSTSNIEVSHVNPNLGANRFAGNLGDDFADEYNIHSNVVTYQHLDTQVFHCNAAASSSGNRESPEFPSESRQSDGGSEGDGEGDDDNDDDDTNSVNGGSDDEDDDDENNSENGGSDDDDDDDDGGGDDDDGDDAGGSSGDDGNGDGEGDEDPAADAGNFNFAHRRLQIPIRMFRACSVKEALAMVLAILSKHNATYDSIIDTCNVVNVMLGRDYLPTSKKLLWKFLNRNNLGLKKHAYCKICHRNLGLHDNLPPLTFCCRRNWMKKKIPYFTEMSLKRQFADFLNQPQTRRLLRAKFEREKINEEALEDIYDSSNYKSLEEPNQPLAYEWNFSYTFNTDGLRVARFSGVQAWPVYVSLNELRKGVRQKYIFLAVVWVGKGEPDMNLIMSTFVDQANDLSLLGIRWILDNNVITSKFFPTTCTVDAQARCKVLNCTTPAGYHACTFCNHPGVQEGGVKFPVLPHPEIEHVPVRRTDASLKQNMVAAVEQGLMQEGVHGPAAVMNLHFFDLGKGFSTDDLHPIYEGAVKDFMELILDDAQSPHYVGQPANIAIINRRLMSIKPPTILARTPRGIDSRSSWRAHEWRNWALYYSVPCMEGILVGRKKDLWKKLVRALFLTARDSITEENLVEGEQLLEDYLTVYQDIFGVVAMRFNIHILSHVIENIRLLGPPHVHSTFQFETWNLKLRKTVKSLFDPVNQIVNRFLIHRFVSSVPYDPDFSERVKLQVRELLEGIPLKQVYRIGDVMLLGKSERRGLSPDEQQVFQEKQLELPRQVIEYQRALLGRLYVKSIRCDDSILSDNTHLYLHDDTFCTVQSILRFGEVPNETCYMFVKVLDVVDHVQGMPHLVRVGPRQVLDMIPFGDVRGFAIKMFLGGYNYYIPVSNSCEVD